MVFLGWQILGSARESFERFETQAEILPLDMSIDLSRPATYHAQFKQTWQACHGQSLTLQLPDHDVESGLTKESLKSLDLKWQVSDSEDSVITDGRVRGAEIDAGGFQDDQIDLAYLFPFELGEYVFTCEVVDAVPALADVDQRLISEYRPCGLELLPAEMMRLFAYGAFMIGASILLPITVISIHDVVSPKYVGPAEP